MRETLQSCAKWCRRTPSALHLIFLQTLLFLHLLLPAPFSAKLGDSARFWRVKIRSQSNLSVALRWVLPGGFSRFASRSALCQLRADDHGLFFRFSAPSFSLKKECSGNFWIDPVLYQAPEEVNLDQIFWCVWYDGRTGVDQTWANCFLSWRRDLSNYLRPPSEEGDVGRFFLLCLKDVVVVDRLRSVGPRLVITARSLPSKSRPAILLSCLLHSAEYMFIKN